MRRRSLLIGAALVAAAGITTAFAATLQVSSSKLTTFDVTQSAPTTTTTSSTSTTTTAVATAMFSVADDQSGQSPDKVYRYLADWSLARSFAIGTGSPRGVALAGTTTYVLDAGKKITSWDDDGDSIGSSLTLSALGSNTASGLAIEGTNVFVLEDAGTDKVHKYVLSEVFGTGTPTRTDISLTNTKSQGLGVDATNYYVADEDGYVYRYSRTGSSPTATKSKQLLRKDSSVPIAKPRGLTLDGSTVWVIDADRRAYSYSVTALFGTGTAGVSATSEKQLNASNSNPQGL